MYSLGAVDYEAVYAAAMEAGTDSREKFEKRCIGYGFTKAKHGTSWDDKCIGHEVQNKLGPFAPPKKPTPAWFWPAVLGGGALAVYFLFIRK